MPTTLDRASALRALADDITELASRTSLAASSAGPPTTISVGVDLATLQHLGMRCAQAIRDGAVNALVSGPEPVGLTEASDAFSAAMVHLTSASVHLAHALGPAREQHLPAAAVGSTGLQQARSELLTASVLLHRAATDLDPTASKAAPQPSSQKRSQAALGRSPRTTAPGSRSTAPQPPAEPERLATVLPFRRR